MRFTHRLWLLCTKIHRRSTGLSTELPTEWVVFWQGVSNAWNHRGEVVHCPFCHHADTRVLDSRASDDGASIRRRRQCPQCRQRFTTVEQMQLSVSKRSGAVEPFDRSKVIQGVRKACKGRPVTEDQLSLLGARVEDVVRATGQTIIPAHQVGIAILGPLRELDQVAYLRFASVYHQYESVEDFETAISELKRTEDQPQLAFPASNP